MPTNYGQAALPIARREVGVKEHPAGSNTGPRVEDFLQGHPPEPWCADFGTWALRQAGFPEPTWNWSYCPAWAQAAREGQLGMRVVATPQPGDVVLYDWGKDGVADHFGIVESVWSPGAFRAVEGNTAYGNDSNGGEVMLRDRATSQVQMFVRLPAVPAPTPAADFYFEELPHDQGGNGPVIVWHGKGSTTKAVLLHKLRGRSVSTVRDADGIGYVLWWKKGTYGQAYRSRPYATEAERNSKRLARQKKTGRTMRPFRGRARSLYPYPKG